MADFRNRYERLRARPLLRDAELSRMVSELARDVERFDTLLCSQRLSLQRAKGWEQAEGRWTQLRAEMGRITTKVHAVLDEIALPIDS